MYRTGVRDNIKKRIVVNCMKYKMNQKQSEEVFIGEGLILFSGYCFCLKKDKTNNGTEV